MSIGEVLRSAWRWCQTVGMTLRFKRVHRVVPKLFIGTAAIITALVSSGLYHVYYYRSDLPDLEGFARFEFPTIGTVYDSNGQPLMELAIEYRKVTTYEDIPPIVRNAIIATEDKRFFSHSGVDFSVFPRVLTKVRMRAFAASLLGLRGQGAVESRALLPPRRVDYHPTAGARFIFLQI